MKGTLLLIVVSAVNLVYYVDSGVIPNTKQYNNEDVTTLPTPSKTLNVTLCNAGSSSELILGHQTSVTVRSPNFGDGEYPENARCKVVFRTSDKAMVVLIQFNSFDLEPAMNFGSCDYDWLCVNGVRYCGDWATNRIFEYLVPAHRTFTLYFSTDVSVGKSGFEAVVAAYTAASDRTFKIASSGSGSGANQITYITTALSNDFAEKYKDSCDRTGYYSIALPINGELFPRPPPTRPRHD